MQNLILSSGLRFSFFKGSLRFRGSSLVATSAAVCPGGAVLSVLHWPPAGTPLLAGAAARPALVLLHGSPGSARNFEDLGPELAARGWDVFAPDLPGFGRSGGDVPSYSILAQAHATLAMLDALSIERAHLASWSMGGGVVLHVAELAPERVASIAQIAAIGVQEAEGSGSYYFEHLKYAFAWFGLIVLPELVPHFGWLGPYGAGAPSRATSGIRTSARCATSWSVSRFRR